LKVDIYSKEIKLDKKEREKIKEIVKKIIIEEGYSEAEIEINIQNDEELKEINKKFLKKNYYTDVITFNEIIKNKINGKIFISIDRVKENSKKRKNNLKEEFFRVIIHSVLHLCNYNDYNKSEKIKIRIKENYYLKKFNISENGI